MKVFYIPGSMSVIDGVDTTPQGVEIGLYSRDTLEQLQARYPGAQIGDSETVRVNREATMRTDPEPCTNSDFMEALEVMPPMGWVRAGGGESFKMVERLSGHMTRIYARTGTRYWSFVDLDTLSHAQIMARVQVVTRGEVSV